MMVIIADRSNKLFLVAFRVIEIKTRSLWEFFIFELKKYFDVHYDSLSIINDKNPRPFTAIKEIFLESHHNYYMSIF